VQGIKYCGENMRLSEFLEQLKRIMSPDDAQLILSILKEQGYHVVDIGIMRDLECECSDPVFFVVELECNDQEWSKIAKQVKELLKKMGRANLAKKVLIVCSNAEGCKLE